MMTKTIANKKKSAPSSVNRIVSVIVLCRELLFFAALILGNHFIMPNVIAAMENKNICSH